MHQKVSGTQKRQETSDSVGNVRRCRERQTPSQPSRRNTKQRKRRNAVRKHDWQTQRNQSGNHGMKQETHLDTTRPYSGTVGADACERVSESVGRLAPGATRILTPPPGQRCNCHVVRPVSSRCIPSATLHKDFPLSSLASLSLRSFMS